MPNQVKFLGESGTQELVTQIKSKLGKTETAADSSKLGGQLPAYYLNYNNLTNPPTIPTDASQLTNNSHTFATPSDLLNKANLDSNGKILISELPDAILGQLLYGGNVNGAFEDGSIDHVATATNLIAKLQDNSHSANSLSTLMLSNTANTFVNNTIYTAISYDHLEGVFFIVTQSGTFAGLSLNVGDWLISTGSSWQKVDNTDAVTSVNGSIGAVTITAASLGAVPYSGATGAVDLNGYGISGNGFTVKTTNKDILGGMYESDSDTANNYDITVSSHWGKLILGGDPGVYYGGYEIANKNDLNSYRLKTNNDFTNINLYGTDVSANFVIGGSNGQTDLTIIGDHNEKTVYSFNQMNTGTTPQIVATREWVGSQSYATESWVTTRGYLTSSDLAGYATTSWVGSNYLPLAGGTMTGTLIANSGNNQRGVKVGDTWINAINGDLIFQNNSAIRFGGASWDYDVWAGLRYAHNTKTIYLGLADSSIFTANNAQSGGKLVLPGIDQIQITDAYHRISQEDGSTITRAGGQTIAVPVGYGTKGVAILADEGVDFGLLYVGSDGAVIANSGDNGYIFKVYDKDQNSSDYASSSSGFSFGVKQNGGGVEIAQGGLSVAGSTSTAGVSSSDTITIIKNGVTTTLGSKNSGWFHIQSTAPVYFGESIAVNGHVELYGHATMQYNTTEDCIEFIFA